MMEEMNQEEQIVTQPPVGGETTAVTPPSPRRKITFLIFSVLVLIVAISLLATVCIRYLKPAKAPSWQGITPGKTTQEQVIKKLGQPMETPSTEFGQVLLYDSGNEVFPNMVLLDEKGRVKSIFLQLSEDEMMKLSELKDKYGAWDKEMYNRIARFTKTYIFAKRGLAVVANKEADEVYQVQYFTPMNLKEYLSNYGKNLFEENPYIF